MAIEGQDDSYDFGSGAGFYVDATTEKWKKHYNMYTYITKVFKTYLLFIGLYLYISGTAGVGIRFVPCGSREEKHHRAQHGRARSSHLPPQEPRHVLLRLCFLSNLQPHRGALGREGGYFLLSRP